MKPWKPKDVSVLNRARGRTTAMVKYAIERACQGHRIAVVAEGASLPYVEEIIVDSLKDVNVEMDHPDRGLFWVLKDGEQHGLIRTFHFDRLDHHDFISGWEGQVVIDHAALERKYGWVLNHWLFFQPAPWG